MDVPKEHAIAFIHLGHSNMAGRARSPNSSRAFHFQETHPRAWTYHPGNPPELALEPTASDDDGFAGPGTALVKEAAMLAAPDQLLHLARLRQFRRPTAPSFCRAALYYDPLIAGALVDQGQGHVRRASSSMLGITERHGTEADRTGFSNCINELVTAIRNDVGAPDLPLLINDYEVEGDRRVRGGLARSRTPSCRRSQDPDVTVQQRAGPDRRASACRTTITSTSTGTGLGAARARDHAGQGLVSLDAAVSQLRNSPAPQ